MKELKITKEEVIKAYDNADDSGKELLENLFGKETFQKPITERIQDFEDVLCELGIYWPHYIDTVEGWPKEVDEYYPLVLITKAYNQGWEPDWSDDTQDKWYPWIYADDLVKDAGPAAVDSYRAPSATATAAYFGSRLSFSCEEHALDAGRKFYDLYRSFLIGK